MAKQLFGNNASSLLAASISDSDLTIQVAGGFGALFPNPGVDEYFLVTLENDSGDIEVVKITSRTSDLLTVPPAGRGQEGTSAQSWTNGQARVELRLTRGTMEVFLQRDGDEMTGDLDMNDNEITDVNITGDSTIDTITEIIDTPLRGAAGDSSNEIAVPSDGSRATAGGADILVAGDTEGVTAAAFVVGQVIMWFGSAGAVPDGWALCNGSNGTPDLRDRFVVGAGTSYALGDTGGDDETSSSGAHTHTTTSGPHTLTEAEMPAHTHRVAGDGQTSAYDSTGVERPVDYPGGQGSVVTSTTGGGAAHSHPDGTTDSQGAHTHTVLPPYKALYFIMFIGF